MSEIWELSGAEIARRVSAREVSVVDVTTAQLSRLADVNPALNAVVQEFPEEALASAAVLDERIAAGADPGPLAGVPVTIKVNVDQKGHATTNGLRLQKDLIAQTDSPVVTSLRRAGAIIVGRTNTPAFSLRWFTDNDVHGQTLNPRDTSLTPGGSSGGAGAAVAAGICAIGHGTDIAGSIRYPAYACGLHGLRPSLGRVATRNASAPDRLIGAQLMAVSGPLARTMADIELAHTALSAPSLEDPWWVPAPLTMPALPRRAALCPAPDGMEVAKPVLAALDDAARALRAAGWQVEERTAPPFRAAADLNAALWMAEARSTRELIEAEDNAAASFVFAQMTAMSPEMDLDTLMAAFRARAGLIREWTAFLAETPLLLCPVSGELPFPQGAEQASPESFAAIMEAQLPQRALPALGMPGLSVATGYAGSAPVGVQLIADRFREDILIQAGRAIEAELGAPGVAEL